MFDPKPGCLVDEAMPWLDSCQLSSSRSPYLAHLLHLTGAELLSLTSPKQEVMVSIYLIFPKNMLELNFFRIMSVVPLLADGHSVNTKCYKDEFCNKKLQHSVANPVNPDQKLFLLFDPVHIFKNFFNNLMNRGSFKCPPFQGKECSPKFDHVKELYKKELGKPAKIAHKITERVKL